MQIIIISSGKVGSKLARVMSGEGHDVVVIDSDSNAFKDLVQGFNGVTLTGVPIDQDVLKQAGIETADALVAVTPDDNINIMACQVAKEIFKVPRVIARIYNPAREHVFHQFGLETICPTNLSVDVIRSMLLGETEVSFHNIGGELISFKQKTVADGEENKKLGAVKVKANTMIFGVIQNGDFKFADPNIKLSRGDVIIYAENTL